MSLDVETDLRQLLRRTGYSPIPVEGKRPAPKAWEQKIDCSPDEITLWGSLYLYANNTGILTRLTPTLDIDILNPDAAEAVETLARERFEERGFILVRTGEAPKRAILLRTDAPFSKVTGDLIAPDGSQQKIELLCNGQQVVVFGIHPKTQAPYRWHGGQPGQIAWQDLPYVTAQEAAAFVAEAAQLLVDEHGYKQPPPRPTADRERDNRGHADWSWLIGNIRDGKDLHDSSTALAAKLVAAGMHDGAAVNMLRGVFETCTSRDQRWQERYDDIPRDVQSARRKFGGESQQTTNGHDRQADSQPQPSSPLTSKLRFVLKFFEQIMVSLAHNYLIKGVLPRAGLAVIWGPPKCGKSFWAFDLMMHIALGWDYRGRRVHQGAVVYLALEGGQGFAARVVAWRTRHLSNHTAPVPFYLLDVHVDMLADHNELIAAIRMQLGEVRPVAVVVDTLNRALIGDENKSDDMARFIRAADRVGKAFDCLIAIIHHCGIQGSRPRGHTSLTGADDAQIAVERDEQTGVITAKVEHQKDGESGAILTSKLERVDVAFDQDGDPISSCIIVAAEPAKPPPLLKGNTKKAYDLLLALIEDEGDLQPEVGRTKPNLVAVSVLKWRELYYAASSGSPDSRQKSFVRASGKLLALKIIEVIGIWVWLPDMPDMPGHSKMSG